MDPVTQGAFGAIFAQTISNKKKILFGSIVGCCAGLAPDLDIFIRSVSDPLLKLEYHRQFTHSIIFIPIGALIVTLFSRILFKKYLSFGESQRVAIVRGVINSPKIIFADEPTSSLDDKNTKKVLELIFSQAKKNNSSIILSSHDQRVKKFLKNVLEIRL